MELIDRHYLQYLMQRDGVSQRQLARAIGWSSHSYMARLMRGDVKTLDKKPAVLIAKYFGEDTYRLFMDHASFKDVQPVPKPRRVA